MATLSFSSKIATSFKEKEVSFTWKRGTIFWGHVYHRAIFSWSNLLGRESKISGDNFLWGNFIGSKHHGDNSLGGNLPGGNLMEAKSKEGEVSCYARKGMQSH